MFVSGVQKEYVTEAYIKQQLLDRSNSIKYKEIEETDKRITEKTKKDIEDLHNRIEEQVNAKRNFRHK